MTALQLLAATWLTETKPYRPNFSENTRCPIPNAAILNQFSEYDPPFIGAGTVLKFYGVKGQSAMWVGVVLQAACTVVSLACAAQRNPLAVDCSPQLTRPNAPDLDAACPPPPALLFAAPTCATSQYSWPSF